MEKRNPSVDHFAHKSQDGFGKAFEPSSTMTRGNNHSTIDRVGAKTSIGFGL